MKKATNLLIGCYLSKNSVGHRSTDLLGRDAISSLQQFYQQCRHFGFGHALDVGGGKGLWGVQTQQFVVVFHLFLQGVIGDVSVGDGLRLRVAHALGDVALVHACVCEVGGKTMPRPCARGSDLPMQDFLADFDEAVLDVGVGLRGALADSLLGRRAFQDVRENVGIELRLGCNLVKNVLERLNDGNNHLCATFAAPTCLLAIEFERLALTLDGIALL